MKDSDALLLCTDNPCETLAPEALRAIACALHRNRLGVHDYGQPHEAEHPTSSLIDEIGPDGGRPAKGGHEHQEVASNLHDALKRAATNATAASSEYR